MGMVLTVAGLGSSGPRHWQTHWERDNPTWRRVPHREWEAPSCADWLADLEAAVAACERPPVLAAHSLGCSLVAHWAHSGSRSKIAGAFLVAPSDVESPAHPAGPVGFSPMPLMRLPFPSTVVASTNDPYVSLARATSFARHWGSQLVTLENAGHLNSDSGHGPWADGAELLHSFGVAVLRSATAASP